MSSRNSESGFMHKLAWTVVLALVFSAGLITGQRLLHSDSQPPLVSVSSKAAEPPPSSKSTDDSETSRPLFSFYDQLSQGIDSTQKDEAEQTPGDGDAPAAAGESPEPDSDGEPAESSSPEAAEEQSSDNQAEEPDDGAESSPGTGDGAAETSGDADPAETAADEEDPGATKYTLQVSAHPSLDRARSRVESLTKKGLDAHVVSAKVPDKGTYYRVRIGEFRSMEAAQKFQEELTRKRAVETFVTPL